MDKIKLMLLIVFAFAFLPIVNALECNEEAVKTLQDELAASDYSLKLEYKDGKKSGIYAKIEGLPEGYHAFISDDSDTVELSSSDSVKVKSGIVQLSINYTADCGELSIINSFVKIPHYDSKKQNVFDDGSVVIEKESKVNVKKIITIIALVITVIGLGIVAFIMIRSRLKHDK